MADSSPVRFGLIGFGRFGGNHARAIAATPGAELVAISANSEASCARAREQFPGVHTYTDYRQMLAKETLDVVDVALPTYLHFECGKAALEAGCHLFIEKPMTPSLAECQQLNALAEARNLRLAVGFKRRVAHLWSAVKGLVDDGIIGRPQYAMFELWRWPYRSGADGWRYDIDRVGSWVLEEPVHCFDKARWLLGPSLGEPLSIYASASSRQPGHPELTDNFSAILEFNNGCHATISQTLSAWGHHHGLKLCGTEGSILASWDGATDDAVPSQSLRYMSSSSREGEIIEVDLPPPTDELFELGAEFANLVEAVRNPAAKLFADGIDGAWSIGISEAAHQSIASHQAVSLKDLEP